MWCVLTNIIFYVALLIGGVLLFFRIKIKTLTKRCNSYTCMVGKTVIVTGANTGIGYYTALDFTKRGAKVILACRNEEKANEAKERIIKATGNVDVTVKLVNFELLDSVREFCKDINRNVDRIDVLVNNAGVSLLENIKTSDGLDLTWQTNYYSPFLITVLLLDKIKKSSPSRIVNIASAAGKNTNITLKTLDSNECTGGILKVRDSFKVYSCTKQANILFSRELASRLYCSQVNVYAVDPGTIHTDIWRNLPQWILCCWIPIMKLILKTSEQGAQTTIYCSVAKECENSTGKLYAECNEIEMYENCKDMAFAKDLWNRTVEKVKLQPNEWI